MLTNDENLTALALTGLMAIALLLAFVSIPLWLALRQTSTTTTLRRAISGAWTPSPARLRPKSCDHECEPGRYARLRRLRCALRYRATKLRAEIWGKSS